MKLPEICLKLEILLPWSGRYGMAYPVMQFVRILRLIVHAGKYCIGFQMVQKKGIGVYLLQFGESAGMVGSAGWGLFRQNNPGIWFLLA